MSQKCSVAVKVQQLMVILLGLIFMPIPSISFRFRLTVTATDVGDLSSGRQSWTGQSSQLMVILLVDGHRPGAYNVSTSFLSRLTLTQQMW